MLGRTGATWSRPEDFGGDFAAFQRKAPAYAFNAGWPPMWA
jgi:hypothetical protein